MLAVIVALPEEAQRLLRQGKWERVQAEQARALYRGILAECESVLAVSGVGRRAAEASAQEVVERFAPEAVLSLGFAGGLGSGLQVGELVVAEQLSALEGAWHEGASPQLGDALEPDGELLTLALRALEEKGLQYRQGGCITVPQLVAEPQDKEVLGRLTGALAVEMESYWIGALCRDRGVPFLTARVVLDTAGEPLPAFVAEFAMEAGLAGRWRQLVPILLRPWWVPRLIRLARAATRAKESLTAFAVAYLGAWVHERQGKPYSHSPLS